MVTRTGLNFFLQHVIKTANDNYNGSYDNAAVTETFQALDLIAWQRNTNQKYLDIPVQANVF